MSTKSEPIRDGSFLSQAVTIIKRTFRECLEDRTPELGAALAYYTVFSLAPLTLILLAVIGVLFRTDTGEIWSKVTVQLGYFLNPSAIDVVQDIARSAADPHKGTLATITGIFLAFVGASAVFAQLQTSLNIIWKVKAQPSANFWSFVRGRILLFSMVAGILFLLLVSLVFEGVIQTLSKYAQSALPGGLALARGAYLILDFTIITLLFAMIFKVLPATHISWRDVWFGAATTSLLFLLGKWVLGIYLASGSASSAYGAASTLVTLLLWIYYSSQIFLFGAELAQVCARRRA